MTIAEVLAYVDEVKPNTYDENIKIGWLSEVDGKVFNDVIDDVYTSIDSEQILDLLGKIADYQIVDEGGFPEEIKDIAGAIVKEKSRDLRSRLAASFLKRLRQICSDLKASEFALEYKKKSFLIGKSINVLKDGEKIPAFAYDLDDELHLLVRYEDGTSEALNSGEVSVRER